MSREWNRSTQRRATADSNIWRVTHHLLPSLHETNMDETPGKTTSRTVAHGARIAHTFPENCSNRASPWINQPPPTLRRFRSKGAGGAAAQPSHLIRSAMKNTFFDKVWVQSWEDR